MSASIEPGGGVVTAGADINFDSVAKNFSDLLPDHIVTPGPDEPVELIDQTYKDGSSVQTHFDIRGEPNEIVILSADRPSKVTTYRLREAPAGDVWIGTFSSGNQVEGLPDGWFIKETGEFRLHDKLLHSNKVAEDYPLEDDPADDTEVTSVTLIDTPPDEQFPDSITNSEDFDAYSVSFADGTQATVLVDTAAVPGDKTTEDMATLHGDRIALLPPNIRTELTSGLNFVRTQNSIDEGAAAMVHGLPLEEPRGLSVTTPALLHLSDQEFQDTMLHETGHIVDDDIIDDDPVWSAAMDADGVSPSEWSKLHTREDFAESYVLWYVVRSGQVTGNEATVLENAFSNRFAILDESPEANATLPDEVDG